MLTFAPLAQFVRRMLSDADGEPDEARFAALGLVGAYIGNSIYSVVMSPTHAFDMQAFGVGAGALTAGIGGWLGLRGKN